MWPAFASLMVCCWMAGVGRSAPLECAWYRFHMGRINTDIIVLLQDMGGYVPVQCKQNQTVQPVSQNIFADAEADSVPRLLLQTVQRFNKVFEGQPGSASWNLEKVRLLKNRVSRQTAKLQECVGDQDAATDTVTTATTSFSDQLTTLHTQEECAWERIRSEFLSAFRDFKAFLDLQ